jgi:hypothetical protein
MRNQKLSVMHTSTPTEPWIVSDEVEADFAQGARLPVAV